MSENNAPSAEKVVPVTEQPPAEGEKGPSKSALKKAAKEKEKAEKAAKRKAAEEAQKKEQESNDVSKEDYGDLGVLGQGSKLPSKDQVPRVSLAQLEKWFQDTSKAEEEGGPQVVISSLVVENARNQSAKLSFLTFSDSNYSIQAVVAASETVSRQMVKFSGSVPTESIVQVHAVVKKPNEPVNSTSIKNLELHIKKIYVVSRAISQLPVQVADARRAVPSEDAPAEQEASQGERPLVSLNTRLDNRVIDLRAEQNQAILDIKDGVVRLFQEFLWARGFKLAQTPKMLGAATEGGASVFELGYFGQKAFLAQSPQFYKQMLVSARRKRVMEVGPVFRAENSNTARHLTEFTGLDMEMAFEEDYHEVISLLEELMLHIFDGLKTQYKTETDLVRTVYNVPEFKLPEAGKVPRIPFWEAVAMLREAGVEIGDYDDFSTPQEKRLGQLVLEKYGTDFYVVDKYPLEVRPFYTMPSAETLASYDPANPNKGYTNSYDFFMRGQEIMSGAQRIHNAEYLEQRMKEHPSHANPKEEGFKDYIDAFRYGCPPHAGGGLGLERIVMLWLGLPNIRLATTFPRDPGRVRP
ncbi:putative aspartyl-tRNA synthetase Dps1 [Polychaeton citri CBS 116435]|uniref:Probable aspartate--tRNA ligase, cytoplasmic n=1 Tax=Polychaeton citri CBS 116435 TaxID=1314669 RepID=A0A9P4QCE7_9PEZI|nr:putative aspartyl-tRNA synthetase Dps1 [Polychaeton citri CBS 116435]